MTPRVRASVPTAVLLAVALTCVSRSPLRAGPAAGTPSDSIQTARDTLNADDLRLGRAAMEHSRGNLRAVVENLEGLNYDAEPTYRETDRAAFLLGDAYLRLGEIERFQRLAASVSRWRLQSPFTRWLEYQSMLIRGEGAGTHATAPGDTTTARSDVAAGAGPEASPLAAALLLRDGDPAAALRVLGAMDRGAGSSALACYLRVLALERTGVDPSAALAALAHADTATALDRDLVGGALIRLATRALERGEDPAQLLGRVPAGSRYAPVARHMLGLAELERGDTARGTSVLDSLAAADSTYAARREVGLALAGQALEHGDWQAAEQRYVAIANDWTNTKDALERRLDQRAYADLWKQWAAGSEDSATLILDADHARALARSLADRSADLTARPEAGLPALGGAAAGRSGPAIPPPPPEDWAAIAALEERAGEASADLERNHWATARAVEALVDRRRYLGIGVTRLQAEVLDLDHWTTTLDSLRGRLDAVDALLQSVRDRAIRHFVDRSGRIAGADADNAGRVHAMRFLYLDGAGPAATYAPPDYPGPDSTLAAEDSLARRVRAVAERIAAETPGRIARSYREAWRPRLIDRAAADDSIAMRSRRWARAIARSVDSSLARGWTSDELQRLDARALRLEARRDSLRGAVANLRDAVAERAVRRVEAAMDQQREAIDYGLAVSTYALSVHLGAKDSAVTAVVREPRADSTAADSTGGSGDEDLNDAEAARWRAASIPLIQSFLERHPKSAARGEMRFRLADLELIQARQEFRDQMAGYLRDQAAGQANGKPLPVLSHASSLELYRKMLAEDRDFPHLDAVLFNAGMILADEANPEAAKYFTELVNQHPDSPYGQQAWMRMGDMQFDAHEFPASVEFYTHAAKGPDPSLSAIAYYKMGWADFNQDRYLDAADAFRSVLDLYAAHPPGTLQVDIEGEARSYIVYSLAGAGGPAAFAAYFDRIGERPYEKRLLLSLGQHFRRYGQFAKAGATDELFIRRYPREADALVSAQRLIETYQKSNQPVMEREARLRFAPFFAPGGEWFAAQHDDSLRNAGAAFAHASLKSVALERHLAARATGSSEDWREALRLYGLLLASWPDDSDRATIELNSGEASAALGEYAEALRHYGAAASAGHDSTVVLALWQRVAITDRWYESTRRKGAPGAPPSPTGSDSLAHAVLEAGDQLLARVPDHPRAADIVWRESQLGLAHGWLDRATKDLERMTGKYPSDPRAPLAAGQRGDALFRQGDFHHAGEAFELALATARKAGRDSLAHRAEQAIPVCYYREAEAAVAADSTRYAQHAALFERVAHDWPQYAHADLADYRAGLAYERAGQSREAVRVMRDLIEKFPNSEYQRDAHLEVARTLEGLAEPEAAADAYLGFATRFPADASARGAYLKAGDLLAAAGLDQRANALRLDYVKHHPDDFEAAMEVLEPLARQELESVTPAYPVSNLLPAPRPLRAAARAAARVPVPAAAPASHLAEYLKLGRAHPALVSRELIGHLRFLQGEEAFQAYSSARLVQPLAKSIGAKQKLLDSVIVRYRRGIDTGEPLWAHACGCRMGEALAGFGDALDQSERPADLKGDDLRAYEDVVAEQSRAFMDRAAGVWSDMLRRVKADAPADEWVTRARASLWKQLATRFYYRPEVEFPLVEAVKPEEPDERAHAEHGRDSTRTRSSKSVAQKEGDHR